MTTGTQGQNYNGDAGGTEGYINDVNLTIYLHAQTMGHRRKLYIRKFYVVKNIYISIYIHRWDTGTQLQWRVTNMARNNLRGGGGGLGGAKRPH